MSAAERRQDHDRRQIEVTAESLWPRAQALLDHGFRLALIAAHEDEDRFRIVYAFVAPRPDRRVELVLATDRDAPSIPSLAGLSFPAGRFEREMRDLFGITPIGHPLPRRLVRHHHWPQGWHPMRSDAGPPPPFGSPEEPYPFLTVEGPGVFEVPVGPIHAGLIEPGHFRFSVVGETILKLKARLWFVHRGIEKLAEGRLPEDVIPLMERVSGDTAVGHTLAYCLAVEEALDWPVPARADMTRAAVLELERLYNHVADIGALCNDAGQGLLNTHALRIRERLLRLNADVTGHRLLRGAVFPGGVRIRDWPTARDLREIASDVAEIVDLALNHSAVQDRFTGTAILTAEQVNDIGVVGYAARASDVVLDARRDHPFTDATAHLTVVTETGGDVLARFLVRASEVQTSVGLLLDLLDDIDTGEIASGEPNPLSQKGSGLGLVEGWRGTIAHRVEIGPDKRVRRLKIVDPSFLNWPALPVALVDTIVPDFPLTNKSFNLSYAGNDL
ncbi:MAG: NADH-quinone oxidoreductase subunit C [Microlunatus sp.]|nr:NADH-quinone oxidoreductase subunit C [Microlunatus sp.]